MALGESVSGIISTPEQLVRLLRFLGSGSVLKLMLKKGELDFYMSDDGVTVVKNGKVLSEREFKKFLSEWLGLEGQIKFEIQTENAPQTKNVISKSRIIDIFRYIELLPLIPQEFQVVIVSGEGLPASIKSYQGKNVRLSQLYDEVGITPIDIAEWMESGKIKLKKIRLIDKITTAVGTLTVILAACAVLASFFPVNLKGRALVYMQGLENKVLLYKVIGKNPPRLGSFSFMPLKVEGDSIVCAGPDRKFGTKDDIKLNLPSKGYKPFFCIP